MYLLHSRILINAFPRMLALRGKGSFVGANQGNVIVSREVTTETCVGSVQTTQNTDLYNGPPVAFGFIEINPLQMLFFWLACLGTEG